jgi:hypothetical protein
MLSSLKKLLMMGQDKTRELRVEGICVSKIKDDGRWRGDRRGYLSLRMVRKESFRCEKQVIERSFVPRNFSYFRR